jgi:hypothetical protein
VPDKRVAVRHAVSIFHQHWVGFDAGVGKLIH